MLDEVMRGIANVMYQLEARVQPHASHMLQGVLALSDTVTLHYAQDMRVDRRTSQREEGLAEELVLLLQVVQQLLVAARVTSVSWTGTAAVAVTAAADAHSAAAAVLTLPEEMLLIKNQLAEFAVLVAANDVATQTATANIDALAVTLEQVLALMESVSLQLASAIAEQNSVDELAETSFQLLQGFSSTTQALAVSSTAGAQAGTSDSETDELRTLFEEYVQQRAQHDLALRTDLVSLVMDAMQVAASDAEASEAELDAAAAARAEASAASVTALRSGIAIVAETNEVLLVAAAAIAGRAATFSSVPAQREVEAVTEEPPTQVRARGSLSSGSMPLTCAGTEVPGTQPQHQQGAFAALPPNTSAVAASQVSLSHRTFATGFAEDAGSSLGTSNELMELPQPFSRNMQGRATLPQARAIPGSTLQATLGAPQAERSQHLSHELSSSDFADDNGLFHSSESKHMGAGLSSGSQRRAGTASEHGLSHHDYEREAILEHLTKSHGDRAKAEMLYDSVMLGRNAQSSPGAQMVSGCTENPPCSAIGLGFWSCEHMDDGSSCL